MIQGNENSSELHVLGPAGLQGQLDRHTAGAGCQQTEQSSHLTGRGLVIFYKSASFLNPCPQYLQSSNNKMNSSTSQRDSCHVFAQSKFQLT